MGTVSPAGSSPPCSRPTGTRPVVLHAQEYVAALYERHGFVRFGTPYDEAGIRHVGMHRPGR
ncbi:GNAT family N-acetyltransferase [Sphingomonas sp. LR61]|uniref:GNAT family N-acetyltransferase n=1 Tax=Sphingomonas sp. LR61 TaxID=3050234 RepID=UPI002FE23B96